MTWYLSQLSWPDVPDNSTRGITWLEFAHDLEISTGLFLPAGAKPHKNAKSQRWRRGACEGASYARLNLLNANIISLSLRVLPLSFSAPFASALETGVKDPDSLISPALANPKLPRKL